MIVYKTTNIVNGKIYVGATSRNLEHYLGSGPLLHEAIKEFGRENFTRETIETCISLENLADREKHWIKKLNSQQPEVGYNTNAGGENLGPHSIETRQKISQSKKGKPTRNKGKKLSPEHVEKLRLSHLGKKPTEETRLKMSQSSLGKKKSKEHAENIAKAKLGVSLSQDHKDKLSVAHLGKKLSPEHVEKLRLSHLGNPCTEEKRLKLKSHKRTEEQKERMRLAWIERKKKKI